MTVDIKFNCPCAARADFDHRWRHHELNKYLFLAKIQNAFGRGFHLPMKVRVFFQRSLVVRRLAMSSSMSWAPQRMESFTIPSQGWGATELPGCPSHGQAPTRVELARSARSGGLFEEL
jgi:hypothetical protein